MQKIRLYDEESNQWVEFGSPTRVLVARHLGEVKGVIGQAEEAALAGCHVAGYIAYEAASAFDASLVTRVTSRIPLAWFAVFEEPGKTVTPENELATDEIMSISPLIDQQTYEEKIDLIKSLLREGDTYQVNFTHQLACQPVESALDVFTRLSNAQPSPYSMFIDTDDFAVCSVSPELFFERRGNRIKTEPMKGTRRRGLTPATDKRQRDELLHSAKDRAENLMIVDMIRNDLGRIAEPGSVQVDGLFETKQLPTVWQQVSRVSAESDASLLALFSALFPCASVTGAPKRRTMEIIRELETEPRGVYTGALGWIKPGGDARFSVGIRTLVVDRLSHETRYGVGGGIVWDSDAADEWQECMAKAVVLQYRAPDFQLLETMKYSPHDGYVLLENHLGRLKATADYFSFPLDLGQVHRKLNEIESDKYLRVRLLVASDGSVEVQSFPLAPQEKKARLKISSEAVDSSNVFLYHKTTQRQVYEDAMAGIEGADDVVLVNERGEVTETTISNIFVNIDGQLYTPPVDCGLLAGTFRQQLIEEGRVKERVLLVDDLNSAAELYTGNSVRGLVPASII